MKIENYHPTEDLSNVKQGDSVYDINIGWGVVYSFFINNGEIMIAVDFNEKNFWTYNKIGCYSNSGFLQSLFTYNPFVTK